MLVAALGGARPGRIIRARPVMCQVVEIPPGAEVPLPARGGDVEGFARLQVHPGRQDVYVDAATRLVVAHRRPGIAIRLKAGPGQGLKAVQYVIDLLPGWLIVRRPGNDRTRVTVLEGQRVRHLPHQRRVAAQHGYPGPGAPLVVGVGLQVGRTAGA